MHLPCLFRHGLLTLPSVSRLPPQVEGWPMQREQYQALVELVREDAKK